MNLLTGIGITCAVVGIGNMLGAFYYALHSDLVPFFICLVNAILLLGMVQIGVFG